MQDHAQETAQTPRIQFMGALGTSAGAEAVASGAEAGGAVKKTKRRKRSGNTNLILRSISYTDPTPIAVTRAVTPALTLASH